MQFSLYLSRPFMLPIPSLSLLASWVRINSSLVLSALVSGSAFFFWYCPCRCAYPFYYVEYSNFRDCRPLHDIHGDCLLVSNDASNICSGHELHSRSARWSDGSVTGMVLFPKVRRCVLVHRTSCQHINQWYPIAITQRGWVMEWSMISRLISCKLAQLPISNSINVWAVN